MPGQKRKVDCFYFLVFRHHVQLFKNDKPGNVCTPYFPKSQPVPFRDFPLRSSFCSTDKCFIGFRSRDNFLKVFRDFMVEEMNSVSVKHWRRIDFHRNMSTIILCSLLHLSPQPQPKIAQYDNSVKT